MTQRRTADRARETGTAGAAPVPPSRTPEPRAGAVSREEDAARRRWTNVWPTALLIVLVLAGGGGWILVWHSPVLDAREVTVRGTTTLAPAQVAEVARVGVGEPMARVDVGAVRARVAAIPRVARAEVTREWPHTIRITVTERTTVAVFPDGPRFAEFDAEGVRFGTVDARPPGVPLVRVDPERATRGVLKGVADVVAALPRAVSERLAEITARTRDDIVLTLDKGVTVDWGGGEDSRRKAVVLMALMNVRAKVYDVSVPGAPVTRNTPIPRDVPAPGAAPPAAVPGTPAPVAAAGAGPAVPQAPAQAASGTPAPVAAPAAGAPNGSP